MLKGLNAKYSIILLMIAVLFVAVILAIPQTQVYAENTSVIISLDSSSKFDAFEDVFSYTYGNTLYVVKNNERKYFNDAFKGECLALEMDKDNVMILSKNGSETELNYYSYDDIGIKSEKSKIGKIETKIYSIFSTDTGDFIIYHTVTGSHFYVDIFEENKDFDDLSPIGFDDAYDSALSNYQYFEDTPKLYAIKNGKVYVGSGVNHGINSWVEINSVPNASDITIANSEIFVNAENGIYKLDPSTNNAEKIGKDTQGSGAIAFTTIGTQNYIFTCENNAITQYIYDGTSCEYYNKFTDTEYAHPTVFDLVDVKKSTGTANIYASPRNMQITSTLTANEYFVVLTEVNSADSGDYFYIAKQDGSKGYIKSSTAFTPVEANSNIESLKIGRYAQGLFPSVNIYKYPYANAEVLTSVTIYDELVVIDNVAQDGDTQVWDYYKVSYVQNGDILTGYVRTTEVSPYTQLKAPSILGTVKISSGSIGAGVYLYALPSEDSNLIVETLTDGVELDLAEEYNKDSAWTKVVYKGTYAYVKTSQIVKKGLTAVQITLIVVSAVVVAASVVMIIILRKKRKIGF